MENSKEFRDMETATVGNGKTTLVLGASLKPERHSNMAVNMLNKEGFPVIGLGLRKGVVGDIVIEKDRTEVQNKAIHTVTLYMNAKRQKEYYDFILNLKPSRIIFNPGAENPELVELARENEIEPVVACTLVMLSLQQY